MTRSVTGSLPPLEPLLAKSLDRGAVRAWIDDDMRLALRAPASHPLRCAIGLGRVLRSGDLSGSELRDARSWLLASVRPEGGSIWSEIVAPEIVREVDGAARDLVTKATEMAALVLTRDDAESVLTTLGTLAMLTDDPATASAEALLTRQLEALDDTATACIEELALLAHTNTLPRTAWLARAVSQDAEPWWLALVALGHADGLAAAPDAPARVRGRNLVVARGATRRPTSVGEVIGCEEDDHALHERGTLVARMFDGDITVFALGLRDGDSGDASLFVCQADGGVDRIEDARLDPPAGHAPIRGRVAWSVPLAGIDGTPVLVVTYRAEGATSSSDERLAIEFTGGAV